MATTAMAQSGESGGWLKIENTNWGTVSQGDNCVSLGLGAGMEINGGTWARTEDADPMATINGEAKNQGKMVFNPNKGLLIEINQSQAGKIFSFSEAP